MRTGEDAKRLPSDPPFALLLSDVTLPGISGDELVPLLAERWPHLKVILMSGYANGKPLPSAAGARAVHFLQKPFDMNTLANEIHTALGE